MDHIFIINPISGRGDNSFVEERINQIFDGRNDFQVVYTQYPGHAIELARDLSEKAACLYAVGGDGTLHEVLNGCNLRVPIAFIPLGSGNDYYAMIEDKKTNVLDILERTIEGRITHVDFATANQERYINCSNMGVDANINYAANQKSMKSRFWMKFKKLNYLYCAFLELFRLETFSAELLIDEVRYKKDILLFNVSLGKQYGGGFKSTPNASLQDGLLDICIVEYPRPVLKLIYLFPMFYVGKHGKYKEITLLQGKKVTIYSNRLVRFGLDGEISNCEKVTFEIIKGGLSLKVPQNSKLV